MHNEEHLEHEEHPLHMGYGRATVIWITLVALTAVTVAVATIDLGDYKAFVAMLVASVKAMFVINVFMHVKYDDALMKAIIATCGVIMVIVFLFLSSDILFR